MEGSPRHWEFSILSSKVSQETSPPVGAQPLQTICAFTLLLPQASLPFLGDLSVFYSIVYPMPSCCTFIKTRQENCSDEGRLCYNIK